MELSHKFTVPAPVEVAWEVFNDLERITPCFPGAALTAYEGDTFDGTVKVKLGPISMQYSGTGRFVERDDVAHMAVIEAKGKDKRGNGTAAATVTASLQSAGEDSTDVIVKTDLAVTGKPAQFGRGVMQDVSDKLLAQFATCLESKMGTSAADEATAIAAAAAAGPASSEAALTPEGTGAVSAAETAVSEASVAAEVAGSSSPTSDDAAPRTRPFVASPDAAEPAELDLGATVLPVLVKHYAPYLVGGLIGILVLRRILTRGRS